MTLARGSSVIACSWQPTRIASCTNTSRACTSGRVMTLIEIERHRYARKRPRQELDQRRCELNRIYRLLRLGGQTKLSYSEWLSKQRPYEMAGLAPSESRPPCGAPSWLSPPCHCSPPRDATRAATRRNELFRRQVEVQSEGGRLADMTGVCEDVTLSNNSRRHRSHAMIAELKIHDIGYTETRRDTVERAEIILNTCASRWIGRPIGP
jgi:hypothetical protein